MLLMLIKCQTLYCDNNVSYFSVCIYQTKFVWQSNSTDKSPWNLISNNFNQSINQSKTTGSCDTTRHKLSTCLVTRVCPCRWQLCTSTYSITASFARTKPVQCKCEILAVV